MFRWTRAFIAIVVFSYASAAQAGEVLTFLNDYEGFLEAAGDVQTIDFETLPDGSPSYGGAEITPDFNYTEQGVTFSTPIAGIVTPDLWVTGNPLAYSLGTASSPYILPTWIIADFVIPVYAIGGVFPDYGTLSVFDVEDELLASAPGPATGSTVAFIGIVSDIPIASATVDLDTTFTLLSSFDFAPIPDPATLVLLGFGAVVLFHRKRRQ